MEVKQKTNTRIQDKLLINYQFFKGFFFYLLPIISIDFSKLLLAFETHICLENSEQKFPKKNLFEFMILENNIQKNNKKELRVQDLNLNVYKSQIFQKHV